MTLKHNFDEIVDRRGTNSSKWLKYPADVLPMWIADSDFRCAQPIVDEMKRLAVIATYGEDGTPDVMNAAWGGIADMKRVAPQLSGPRTMRRKSVYRSK